MLLLDEMFPRAMAEALTSAGCDTKAVSADRDLCGMPDADVLQVADAEGRVLVTANISDFAKLSAHWLAEGRTPPGIVMVSTKTFPMVRNRTGLLTAALLQRHAKAHWPTPGQLDFLVSDK